MVLMSVVEEVGVYIERDANTTVAELLSIFGKTFGFRDYAGVSEARILCRLVSRSETNGEGFVSTTTTSTRHWFQRECVMHLEGCTAASNDYLL